MIHKMEFALYFSNPEHLEHIDETLHPIDCGNIPVTIMDALFGDINTMEYYKNLEVLNYLQKEFKGELRFSRLYFGQETCEYLIPELEELKRAYYISRQLGWDFTYVTGYVTDKGLEKAGKNLEFLVKEGGDTEVVVNDWGVLSFLHREFAELKPVLGRLLIKQKRLARFAFSRPPINMARIDVSMEEIAKNQGRVLRGLNISIKSYREELKSLGIERVEVDIVPQGVDIDPQGWGLRVSFYFPWAYITAGRNCSTAGIIEPEREYVVVGEGCPRLCRKINRASNLDQFATPIIQRGNAVFAYTQGYAYPYLKGEIPVDRLIFQPYIPI